jgi:hypothetical protein
MRMIFVAHMVNMLMLLFSLEDGGSIFLRNISIYLEVHMALVHKTNNGNFSHLRNKYCNEFPGSIFTMEVYYTQSSIHNS